MDLIESAFFTHHRHPWEISRTETILKLIEDKASDTQYVDVGAGDGELYEGAVWEAIMFAGHHKLDNLILIVDENKVCLLDYCRNVLDLQPLKDKFKVFHWKTAVRDGHDVMKLCDTLMLFKNDRERLPTVYCGKENSLFRRHRIWHCFWGDRLPLD